MLLVDILARELEKWPSEAKIISQDANGCAHPYSYAGAFDGKQWRGPVQSCSYRVKMPALASDHATAIVTRADWQAAKDKLEGKTVKKPNANKDGWVRHRGGKCPVEAGTLVDVKYRGGGIVHRHYATADKATSQIALAAIWQHRKDDRDIMYYRIHKPDPEAVKESLPVEPVAPIAGPLQWRDRITEIDAESKAEAARHSAAMTALDTERAELVQKLASEGLAMIERKADPVEDMSDPANWRKGDIVKCVGPTKHCTKGKEYSLRKSCIDRKAFVTDDDGDSGCPPASSFEFVRRPTN